MMKYTNFMLMLLCLFAITLGCNKSEDLLLAKVETKKSSSSVINVKNPGNDKNIQPNILAAYNSAKDGDVIVIPSGTFRFEGTLIFKKTVSLKGAGLTKTILYRPNTIPDNTLFAVHMINYQIWKDVPSNIVISDITFRGKNPSIKNGDGKSTARDYGLGLRAVVDFVVTRCRFEFFGEAGLGVSHRDYLARGLVYNCSFYRNMKGEDGQGTGYGVVVKGENKSWVENPKFGSSNFIFIEDNTFEFHRHAIAAGNGALYVARYNKIYNNLISQAIDMHGVSSTGSFSSRAAEIYNNYMKNSFLMSNVNTPLVGAQKEKDLARNAIVIRGGECLIYKNTSVGFRHIIGLTANFLQTDKSTYPKFTQIGYKSGVKYGAKHSGSDTNKGNGDVFMWENNFQEYNVGQGVPFENSYPSLIVEKRDYHFEKKPSYVPYTYPHPLRID